MASLDDWDDRNPLSRFLAHRESHPYIETIIKDRARQFRQTGTGKIGIALIWEVMRWDRRIQTGELPKLDNNLKAWYARALMAENEDLCGLFDLRRSAADDHFGLSHNPATGTPEWPSGDARPEGGLW